MATKTAPPKYEPETQYQVELAAKVEMYGQTFYPGHEVTMRGDVLATLNPDAVRSATPAAQPKA
jgi:hypothetical protein